MEITESIYKDVVEPSCKRETTKEEANCDGHIRKTRGGAALPNRNP